MVLTIIVKCTIIQTTRDNIEMIITKRRIKWMKGGMQ